MDSTYIATEADKLREEAKDRLNKIFRDSNLKYQFEDVDRIVDCIIGAGMLNISSVFVKN